MLETKWKPIAEHPKHTHEVVLAEFVEGDVYIADRGYWEEGETREEWEEVEGGVQVKIWEEQEEGGWQTNHCIDFEPTHYAELEGE